MTNCLNTSEEIVKQFKLSRPSIFIDTRIPEIAVKITKKEFEITFLNTSHDMLQFAMGLFDSIANTITLFINDRSY